MSWPTLLVVALGLSADAFAVAVGSGLQRRTHDLRQAVVVGLVFGLFQAGMPLVGYLVGSGLAGFVESYDHWVAFALLTLVGASMLREALGPQEQRPATGRGPTGRQLLVLGLATSIDALAVGVSFAFLTVPVVPAVVLIGVVTFGVSGAGVLLGQRAGARWQRPAEVAGGLVLIGIGVRILLEHLRA